MESAEGQELALDFATGGGWSGISHEESEFRFTSPGWSPASQRWEDFESRTSEDFQHYLEEYRERLSGLMKKRGYIPAPEKRKHEHFEWLVLYHLVGKSCGQIASERCNTSESVGESTIQSGVNDAARLVGMKVRPGRRGPKRKP